MILGMLRRLEAASPRAAEPHAPRIVQGYFETITMLKPAVFMATDANCGSHRALADRPRPFIGWAAYARKVLWCQMGCEVSRESRVQSLETGVQSLETRDLVCETGEPRVWGLMRCEAWVLGKVAMPVLFERIALP